MVLWRALQRLERHARCMDKAVAACSKDCSGQGHCHLGQCFCYEGWAGSSCDRRGCSPACGEHGTCDAQGMCLCSPDWVGHDCSVEKRALYADELQALLGPPFNSSGRLEEDTELFTTGQSFRKYGSRFCKAGACKAAWNGMQALLPYLPDAERVSFSYRKCAVVTSSPHLLNAGASCGIPVTAGRALREP